MTDLPYTYKIDTKADVVISIIDGRVSPKQWVDLFFEIANHPDYHPGISEICDLRRADLFSVEMNDVHKALRRWVENSDIVGEKKIAVIAESDLAFGLSRMFEQLSGNGDFEVRVFRAPYCAEKWLDVELEDSAGVAS